MILGSLRKFAPLCSIEDKFLIHSPGYSPKQLGGRNAENQQNTYAFACLYAIFI